MTKKSLDIFFENFFLDKWYMSLQKIFDINSQEMVGGELLLRVFDNDILANSDYFPNAFYDSRFNELTLCILKRVKSFLVEQPEKLPNYLSINIVPLNIKSDEIKNELLVITKILKKINKKLAIEISEIFVKEDFQQFLPLAHQLREAGALIGLDDYGATEIDIIELEFFPLDFVKLDRSYSINEKYLDSRFHKKMIKIAKDRRLMLIAEGVENKTLNILKSFGYNFVQGYIFHKPEKFIS